jgi:hypothetical protein
MPLNPINAVLTSNPPNYQTASTQGLLIELHQYKLWFCSVNLPSDYTGTLRLIERQIDCKFRVLKCHLPSLGRDSFKGAVHEIEFLN